MDKKLYLSFFDIEPDTASIILSSLEEKGFDLYEADGHNDAPTILFLESFTEKEELFEAFPWLDKVQDLRVYLPASSKSPDLDDIIDEGLGDVKMRLFEGKIEPRIFYLDQANEIE